MARLSGRLADRARWTWISAPLSGGRPACQCDFDEHSPAIKLTYEILARKPLMSQRRLFLLSLIAAFSFAGCGESEKPKSDIASGTSPAVPAAAQAAAESTMSARMGDVQVTVQGVEIGPVPVLKGLRSEPINSKKHYLQIDIEIGNLSQSKSVEYVWGGWGDPLLTAQFFAMLRDEKGNAVMRVNISLDDKVGSVTVAGQQTRGAEIGPGETISDRLVFMVPEPAAQSLTLSLPAEAVGEQGEAKITIPISNVERAPVDEAAVENEAVLAKALSELPQGDDFDPDTVLLVPLDLSEAGLDTSIDAPPGTTAEKDRTSGDVLMKNPVLKSFRLAVGPGCVTPQIARSIWRAQSEGSTIGEVVQEAADAFVARLDAPGGDQDYVMAATKTIGHVDLYVTTPRDTVKGRALLMLPKSIALLQLRCAQTLRPNEGFDSVDSFEALIDRGLLQACSRLPIHLPIHGLSRLRSKRSFHLANQFK